MHKLICRFDPDGSKFWYKESTRELHRLDGPAVEWAGGKTWYYYGKYIPVDNQEEFERYIKIMFLE